ncbi:hypothetical protein ABL78_5926 [Leptomonas seymouri]|uniref:Uncharacterized protein n=1 Tax=Leptomonas seymouri TaxID=5684 RepID=A0A0N0P4N1_LEPSE|nr:hypothetical protein ABL78_5926 [Leptomonas seymouri]|eukprot:KPI85017.1 hypothetical protein ABL78_5926 [Leptomonas seymouri]
MLSFKRIAGFLKKVSSSGRDDASKDPRQRGGTESGGGSNGGWSTSASEGANGVKAPQAARAAASGTPATHLNKKADDTSFIESPLFGMPSAFGDNSMFASSSILKGLPPNTSTQDVLRHIQRVVQDRNVELQQQQEAAEAETNECRETEMLSNVKTLSTTSAAARSSFDSVSPRSSHSLIPTAAPSPLDAPHVHTSSARTAANFTAESPISQSNAAPVSVLLSPTTHAAVPRERLQILQRIRGEMIDALDLCLQEVPEDCAKASAEKPRPEKDGASAASGENADSRNIHGPMTRSNSVVLPSFTSGQSGFLDGVVAGAVASADASTTNWDENNNSNASLDGARMEMGTATPRNPSISSTPVETAELPASAIPCPDQPPSPAVAPAAPLVFTHYEWRCLLLQIVEVIVRIDRTLMADVSHRAMEKLTPGMVVPFLTSPADGTTEFRWQCLSQVFPPSNEKTVSATTASGQSKTAQGSLTPPRQPRQVDAVVAAALLNSPHLGASRFEALPRAPNDTELPMLPANVALLSAASGQSTPKESSIYASGPVIATAAATRAAIQPSPTAKMKPALEDNGTLPPDSRVDYAISKENKKLLEELLTVACLLATWAIIKAILRHHLQVLSNSQKRRSSSRINVGASGGTAINPPPGANAPVGSMERVALDMSLSGTMTDFAITSNSAATTSGRPPLVPLPLPVPATATSGASDEHNTEAAGALSYRKKPSNDANFSDDVPYIDWEAVVQELDEWMGHSPGHIVAECTLCASFLRDDGREMVMCMLQKPKPRHLLSNIHRHAEKLRHTDPMSLVTAAPALTPMASPRIPASGASTAATTSPPTPSSTTVAANSTTSSGASTAATGGGGSGAAAATPNSIASGATAASANATTGGVPPSPTMLKASSTLPPSTQATVDDPTLVMDDLVAQLELVYRKAVSDTWSTFIENAIEAEMPTYASPIILRSTSEGTVTDKSESNEKVAPAVPQSVYNVVTGEPLPRQQSNTNTQLSPSAPESPLTRECITDTKTLCRLATAYFFGSDAWSERKRERRFAVLYRSMRSRMERYSESAATRRNIRRGNSAIASPTQTLICTTIAGLTDASPFSEPTTARTASANTPTQQQRQQRAPHLSAAAAGATVVVQPTTSTRVSPLQTDANLLSVAPVAPAVALTPTKFSVEDTSSRVPAAAAPAVSTSNIGSSAAAAPSSLLQVAPSTTGPLPRHGLLSSQLVAHQLLSSNASNAAASNHSTPLAKSLQMNRDGGSSDLEAASSAPHVAHLNSHAMDRYTLPMTDQSATWTPSGSTTPLPEPDQMLGQQLSQQQQQQQAPSVGATPLRSEGNSNAPSLMAGGSVTPLNVTALPPPPPPPPSAYLVGHPLSAIVLERIVNMSWSAALHKRGEQCLSAKPPRLEEAEQNVQEERLVAGAFGDFRARQRSLVSLINARLASGKSVEALSNAQKHFRFEKKDWTSHGQTIFSALRYLQSMVMLVRAQAACRVYGAVIETVQFVLPQAMLCEQMLQVLAPRPRRDCIIRFANCRSKLLRSYVYLLKECWMAHAAFNDHAKAAKYFSQCIQVLQMLRRRSRESQLFAAYMERGSQLMKIKDYKKSVELFKLAVNIAKKSLHNADAAAAVAASGTASSAGSSTISAAPSLGLTVASQAKPNAATVAPQQQFHRNLHLRSAGSGLLYTAEEHIVGTSAAAADDLEFAWRVAESERMLALSYVTQAEHEVNVRERREELSNAVSNAYSSQRALQRWQTKGGTPKRLLTAVPCSLIVICKGLLLLNQARKAALLLEPLIENKASSALVRPPMWREILDPTEDPYTAEDLVLRTYVCSVKIAVYMLYARCLAEFDGERALRAVTQVDQLLQESDAWIYAIRTELRRALEKLRNGSEGGSTIPTSPYVARSVEQPRAAGPIVVSKTSATAITPIAADEHENTRSAAQQGSGGAEVVGPATVLAETTVKTTEVPPLLISKVSAAPHNKGVTSTSGDGIPIRMISTHASRCSPECNSLEEAPLRQRRSSAVGTGPGSSVAPSRNDLMHEEDDPNCHNFLMQTPAGCANVDLWNCGNASSTCPFPGPPSSGAANAQNTSTGPAQAPTSTPTLRVHMESASECMTALFALREGKSHIRKALRDIFIISGDAHSLIKNWEEALKSYSHALVISMSEVEAANAAAQSRRNINQYATPRQAAPSPRSSNVGGNGGNNDDANSLAALQLPTNVSGAAGASNLATVGGADSSVSGGGGGATASTPSKGASTMDTRGHSAAGTAAAGSRSTQCWGQVVPLDEEFFLWDEEDGLIADNFVNRDLTASTAAKDLRAVVADEERMDSRACESLVLSKLANVYRALDKPTTAIHYHSLVLDYANECNDKLLAYNSMLSLARLYTAAASLDEARDAWAKVSNLAKEYEDKEVSRETKRNIVAGQDSAGMYLDVVKTAEELEKLATGEEGEDAAADRRFALEALANANLQLGQYDACIAALDKREKVQEKSAEWNGRLLSMRAKARMGLNKPADAIKVMQSWTAKARNLCNWVELGKANSALSAAYASENQNMQARHHHEATLNAFALSETLNEDCQHIALDSARWLVHYAYLDDSTVQVDPSLTYTGGCLTSDSEASGGDFRYPESGLCNNSGDLGEMLAKEEEMRRSSSSLITDSLRGRCGSDEDEDDFFGGSGSLANHRSFRMQCPKPADSAWPTETPKTQGSEDDEEGEGEKQRDALASNSSGSPSEGADEGGQAGAGDEEGEEEGASDEHTLQDNLTNSFQPADPSCATQLPSLASSFIPPLREYPPQSDNVEVNFSGSSAGQSEAGDNDALVEENDDETRQRHEVDEVLRTMDDDVEAVESKQQSDEVASAVAAAARSHIFFYMEGDEDVEDPKSTSETAYAAAGAKGSTKSSASSPPPTLTTTAAVKTSGNATAAGGTKTATGNYVPPPTALANVFICSRPAAAAAGTDVLEMSVDAGRSALEPTSGAGSSSTVSPLTSNAMRGSGGGVGFGEGRDNTGAVGGTLARQDGEGGHHERKPTKVRTTYYRGAIEMIETTAQLLLVPRSVSRLVIPYSPAEAVDFALLAHPRSLFVFYFAEYTTEYGAQCDVVVRPPGTAAFMKLRTQVSLKEYHSKDVVNSLLATLSADALVADRATAAISSAGSANNTSVDPGALASHPFGGAMAKAAAAAAGASSGSVGVTPTLSNVRPDVLRAALDDETRSCLYNLHADAWQPVIDRMHREHVSYQDAETVIIMPDIALLHLPFAGLLPSPHYGGEDAPLGEQFTLIVTPSLTHFVCHSMSEQHAQQDPCGALDPSAKRYIFVPYDAANSRGAAAVGAQLSTGAASASADLSASSSPRRRQQAPQPAKAVGASQSVVHLSSSGAAFGKPTNSISSEASPASWPPVSSAQSNEDSTLAAVNSMSTTRQGSAYGATGAAETGALLDGASAHADDGTFEGLLKTWRVHRGCTRKELIHAFTDYQTRALMFLGPIDQSGVRVADGVVTMQDIMQSLQQARSQQSTQSGGAGNGIMGAANNKRNGSQSLSGAAQVRVAPTALLPPSAPSIPLPPLCTHMDLLVLTADRGIYPSVTSPGLPANLCMSLGVHRVLRLNVVHGLDPNDEHREFIARFLSNLRKVMRWKLSNPYAVALRTTIAEVRAKGMSSSTWGAFTLVGSA